MCRYSCIVEPLMESLCGCLAAGAAAALRRAAVRALTRLLLAGYLRLRTPLYYRCRHFAVTINCYTFFKMTKWKIFRNSVFP